jgi:hypothetical protein
VAVVVVWLAGADGELAGELDLNVPAAPGCHQAQPASATKHLTIETDHKVPRLTGSAPPDARDTLAMPKHLWQDTRRG